MSLLKARLNEGKLS